MLGAISNILNLLLQPCYGLAGNWWVAILLFTALTKVILLPISLWCQKNAIGMLQLMPDLNRIKARHYGDRETIGEMQAALYKERHYHPFLSLVPLIIQIIILIGLVDVVHGIADSGAAGTELLGVVPIQDGGAAWLWPLFAGLSAVVLGWAQNRINPLQHEQSRKEQLATNGLSVALALVLGVFVAAGLAFYWICSNLLAIAVQAICNQIIKPEKYVDYDALAESRAELEALDSVGEGPKRKWYERDPLAKREKADFKRFFSIADKHLVFYSEGSGFYKYFEGTIRYILANSAGVIHYVTNDPNDQVFELSKEMPRLVPYYIGPKRAITLMMKMDADVVVMTLHDLDTHYIKRSYVRKDIEYVFMFHHMTSCHLVSTKTAQAHYDTVLCVGPHQIAELRRAEELYGFPRKRLVEAGYDLLDSEIAAYEKSSLGGTHRSPIVLIAPSWQEDNILDTCIDDMLTAFVGKGWRIVVRPHPEYTKRYAARWDALQSRWASVPRSRLMFESDFSSSETVWSSDVLITDWSSVAVEFSFATLKPSIFVDTPMKVHNPNWKELGIEPTDISIRNRIGVSVQPGDVDKIPGLVSQMVENPLEWNDLIREVRSGFVFNLGEAAKCSGDYILEAVLKAQADAQEGKSAAGGTVAVSKQEGRA